LCLSEQALPGMVWPVPASWTLADAATIPAVYLTCFYGMCVRGRLSPGESILIHSGTGGVGQAAIAIALSMGCDVYTTVGSADKVDYLCNRYPRLQRSHIASSRTTEFEAMVHFLGHFFIYLII
jgi:fatty acid synthase